MIDPKHLITFVVGLFICTNTLSQSDQNYFTQLTTRDGLSSNTIMAIHQDYQGVMWFRTPTGLSRYDGIEFKDYSYSRNRDYEFGSYLLEDSLGNLWFDRSVLMLGRDGAFRGFRQLYFDYLRGGFLNLWGIQSAQIGSDHHLYLAAPRK